MHLYDYVEGNVEFEFQSVNTFLENRNLIALKFWIWVVFFWGLGGKSFENVKVLFLTAGKMWIFVC